MEDLQQDFMTTNLIIEECMSKMKELVRMIHEENAGREDQPLTDTAKSLGLELVGTCKRMITLMDENAEKCQKMSAIIREMVNSLEIMVSA